VNIRPRKNVSRRNEIRGTWPASFPRRNFSKHRRGKGMGVGRLVGIHCIRNASSGVGVVWKRTMHIQDNGLVKSCGFTGFRVSWLFGVLEIT